VWVDGCKSSQIFNMALELLKVDECWKLKIYKLSFGKFLVLKTAVFVCLCFDGYHLLSMINVFSYSIINTIATQWR
jgi:hypothetical protein